MTLDEYNNLFATVAEAPDNALEALATLQAEIPKDLDMLSKATEAVNTQTEQIKDLNARLFKATLSNPQPGNAAVGVAQNEDPNALLNEIVKGW